MSPGFLLGSEVPKCGPAVPSWSLCAFREPGWEAVGRRTAFYSSLFLFHIVKPFGQFPFGFVVAQSSLWLGLACGL